MLTNFKRFFPIVFSLLFAACSAGGGAGVTPAVSPLGTSPGESTQSIVTTDSYASAVLNDGPTAYYRLDDTGTTAYDKSGNGLNGAVGSSMTESASGLLVSSADSAMSSPGLQSSAGVVKVAANTKLQPSTTVTIEGFIRFSSVPKDWSAPLAYGADSGADYAPYEWFFRGGKLETQFHLTTGTFNVVPSFALSANTTYYVVSTYNGSTASMYINGKLVASVSKSGKLTGYRDGLAIGDDAGFSNPGYAGKIDEVAVYAGKALTASQVAAHYAAANSAAPAPTPTPTNAPTSAPTPTNAPTASPTPAPVASNVPYYHGCPVFTAGDWYNASVVNAPVDPSSASRIATWQSKASAQGGGGGAYYMGPTTSGHFQVNLATNSTPSYHPASTSWRSASVEFPAAVPWQSSYWIQAGNYSPARSDQHGIVLNTDTCVETEMYETYWTGSGLQAYSAWEYNLNKPMQLLTSGTGLQGYGDNGAGMPIFAGSFKDEELAAGVINHAINIVPPVCSLDNNGYVSPAGQSPQSSWCSPHGYSMPANGTSVPYGAHLRLHANFRLTCTCPQTHMVVKALQTYGAYITDTGSPDAPLQIEYMARPAGTGANVASNADLGYLDQIHPSDFDLLAGGTEY